MTKKSQILYTVKIVLLLVVHFFFFVAVVKEYRMNTESVFIDSSTVCLSNKINFFFVDKLDLLMAHTTSAAFGPAAC